MDENRRLCCAVVVMVLEGMCEVCVEVMFVCKHWL